MCWSNFCGFKKFYQLIKLLSEGFDWKDKLNSEKYAFL